MSSGQAILGLWSIILEPGKTLSQNVAPGIQITNISFGAEVTGSDRCVVSMRYPEFQNDSDDEDEDEEDEEDSDEDGDDIKLPKLITKEAVIAILRPDFTEQVSVNITLVDDVEVVEFSVTGPNAVHLVGHYCRQEDFDQEPFSDSDDENPYGDSDDEEIDSDFEGDYDMEEGISGMLGEDDDEEDSEAEERFVELAAAIPSKKRTADADVSVDVTADESMTSTMSKNQKKKLAKKMKATDGSAVEAVVAAAAPVAKKAAVVVAPVVAAAAKKEAVVAPVEKKAGKSAPVTLAGGLIIHDAKKGEGAIAKSGKKVSMRYIGKLDNGKIFDSNTKGSPLSFTLGRGEVIKGWDNGIIGMAVGGERKLTIPAALAYGKKGTQGIPGNSTLTFDVKLISIK